MAWVCMDGCLFKGASWRKGWQREMDVETYMTWLYLLAWRCCRRGRMDKWMCRMGWRWRWAMLEPW